MSRLLLTSLESEGMQKEIDRRGNCWTNVRAWFLHRFRSASSVLEARSDRSNDGKHTIPRVNCEPSSAFVKAEVAVPGGQEFALMNKWRRSCESLERKFYLLNERLFAAGRSGKLLNERMQYAS